MRPLIMIIFLFSFSNLLAQKLVDQFGYGSDFCSGTFYLYSDSSFYYERGCEQRSDLTIGTYTIRQDTLILVPFRLGELNIIEKVEFKKIPSSSVVTCQYRSIEDSVAGAYVKFTSLIDGKRWISDKLDTDSLKDDQSIKMDTSSNFQIRTRDVSIAVCPFELNKLMNKKVFYELKPDFNEVIIRLNLPFEILKQMILYEMKYSDMEPTIMTKFDRIIKIEYH